MISWIVRLISTALILTLLGGPSLNSIQAIKAQSSADEEVESELWDEPEDLRENPLDNAAAKINSQFQSMDYFLSNANNNKLIIDPIDLNLIKEGKVDQRVLATLNWLVTPLDQGGAGHEQIKIRRIDKNHTTERRAQSKEYPDDLATGQQPNISSHYIEFGEAFDIEIIDNVKCTLFEDGDPTQKLDPKPIEVAWQSNEGWGRSAGLLGASPNTLFENLSNDQIQVLVEDALGIKFGENTDFSHLKDENLGYLSNYLGWEWLEQSLEMPSTALPDKWSFGAVNDNLGQTVLGEGLSLPPEGMKGNNLDEWLENIGRSTLEKKLSLPAGSLSGKNSTEVLQTIGRRKMEENLDLPRDTLLAKNDKASIEQAIGARGKARLNLYNEKDRAFGLPSGAAEAFLAGQTDVYQQIGRETVANTLSINDYSDQNQGQNTNPLLIGINGPAGGPQSTKEKNGDRTTIKNWLGSGNIDAGPTKISESFLASQNDLDNGDIELIFTQNKPGEAFQKLGAKTLYKSLTGESINRPEKPDLKKLKADKINLKVNRYVGLQKQDIIDLIRGKKKINNYTKQIGLAKWELEFDLPENALAKLNLDNNQSNQQAKNNLYETIGQAIYKDQGAKGQAKDIDQKFNLTPGTAAAWQANSLSTKDFQRKIGEGHLNNLANKDFNQQMELEGSYQYKLNGADLASLFTQDPSSALLKTGGRALDEVFDFDPGSSADIVAGNNGADPKAIAGQKLGQLAGLSLAVSLDGNLEENLGRAKLAATLGVPESVLRTTDLAVISQNIFSGESVAEATKANSSFWQKKSNQDRAKLIDNSLGLPAGSTQKFLTTQISPANYYQTIGNRVYEIKIKPATGQYLPVLKDQKLSEIAVGLLDDSANPKTTFAKDGGRQIAENIGVKQSIPLDNNFKQNLGRAKVEDGLGLAAGSFQGNLNDIIGRNKPSGFASAFRIWLPQEIQGKEAEILKYLNEQVLASPNTSFWQDPQKANATFSVDASLLGSGFTGTTKKLLTGQTSPEAYSKLTSSQNLKGVTTDKLANQLSIRKDDTENYSALTNALNTFQANNAPAINALAEIADLGLSEQSKLDTGSWQSIIANPDRAWEVLIGQGERKLAQQLGIDSDVIKQFTKDGLEVGPFNAYFEQGQSNGQKCQSEGVYNKKCTSFEDWLVGEIMGKTPLFSTSSTGSGIPKVDDARRFLEGDIRGGYMALGAVQLVKQYVKEFTDQFKQKYGGDWQKYLDENISYEKIMAAYEGIFTDEQNKDLDKTMTDDQKIVGNLWDTKQDGQNMSRDAFIKNYLKEAFNQKYSEIRQKLQTEIFNKTVDAQLHKLDKNIPFGFAQGILGGKLEVKTEILVNYLENMLKNKLDLGFTLPQETLNILNRFIQNPKDLANFEALKNTGVFKQLETFLQNKGILNFTLPNGSIESLFKFTSNGDLGQLKNIFSGDWNGQQLGAWLDKALNLPTGSSWEIFQKYDAIQKAGLNIVAAKGDVLNILAQQAGIDIQKLKAAEDLLKNSQNLFQNAGTDLQNYVANMILGSVFSGLDNSLGLPPGTSSQLATMIIMGIDPISLAVFLLSFIFGDLFGDDEPEITVRCTGGGYYPGYELPKPAKITPGFEVIGRAYPLPEFDGMDANAYRAGAVAAAKYKVNAVLGEVLEMPDYLQKINPQAIGLNSIPEPKMITPSQIMTLQEKDIKDYLNKAKKLWWPPANWGMKANPVNWDTIHIGF